MSELNLDSSSQIIKSSNNNILIFKINTNLLTGINKNINITSIKSHITSITNIKIENLSHNYVALRVRTTKKFYYAVDPIYTIISPKSTKSIRIQYNSQPNEEITSIGHKFRFEGFIIDDKEKNTKNILGLFQQYIKSQKLVKGNIIKKNVIFVDENNKVITSKNNKIINLNNDKIDIPLKECNKIELDLDDINISGLELNEKLKQEIKEVNELKNIHKNLIKNLEGYQINKDSNSFIDIIKEVKEILIGIKNNKFFLIVFISFFFASTIFGFYLNK